MTDEQINAYRLIGNSIALVFLDDPRCRGWIKELVLEILCEERKASGKETRSQLPDRPAPANSLRAGVGTPNSDGLRATTAAQSAPANGQKVASPAAGHNAANKPIGPNLKRS